MVTDLIKLSETIDDIAYGGEGGSLAHYIKMNIKWVKRKISKYGKVKIKFRDNYYWVKPL